MGGGCSPNPNMNHTLQYLKSLFKLWYSQFSWCQFYHYTLIDIENVCNLREQLILTFLGPLCNSVFSIFLKIWNPVIPPVVIHIGYTSPKNILSSKTFFRTQKTLRPFIQNVLEQKSQNSEKRIHTPLPNENQFDIFAENTLDQ